MNVQADVLVRKNRPVSRDYAQTPLIVYWEMTQACALACRHCRAEAMPKCHPDELTHEESRDLLRQIVSVGDPLGRLDLYDLIDEARSLGLQVSITPSATQALTAEVISKLKDHGIQSLGLSLDGSNAA